MGDDASESGLKSRPKQIPQIVKPLPEWYEPHKVPCMRHSLLWGIGCGALAGLQAFRMKWTPRRMGDLTFAGFVGAATMAWVSCNMGLERKEHILRDKIDQLNRATRAKEQARELKDKSISANAAD